MRVSSVEDMRILDQEAGRKFGLSEDILMENAGHASCFAIQKEFGIAGRKFAVICGAGNNGGDGMVAARMLLSNNGSVRVYLTGDPDRYTGAARRNFEIAQKAGIEFKEIGSTERVKRELAHCDAVVDAIFGTGLSRAVEAPVKTLISWLNKKKKTVFSLDIPSGINGDTGEVMGEAVRASFTIAFGLPKRGNILYPGFEYCGKLFVSHISFPPSHYDRDSIRVALNTSPPLPRRSRTGHKGTFGDVLFISGAAGYLGAPYFSSFAFLKAGGGYARLAAPSSIAPLIASRANEVVLAPQPETSTGGIAFSGRDGLLALARRADMVVIGPGLSLDEETQRLVRSLVPEIEKPLLIDGDGITAVSHDLRILEKRSGETILTPHPGEMSRLLDAALPEWNAGRIDFLRDTAEKIGAHVVLKGAHSLIGTPDGRVYINLSGNPGMAKAGTGDVLNGTIAAMFGMGLSIPEAVRKGVFIHGLAADLAAAEMGEDGVTPQDLLAFLPRAVRADREELGLKQRYWPEII
ncbi:MAG TPA: NAD(P)H-hydrate dehydratase [Syntrophales bacterium]|nr:NAD(P)H-hydrate dehydratase [Syntrophales bacterium]